MMKLPTPTTTRLFAGVGHTSLLVAIVVLLLLVVSGPVSAQSNNNKINTQTAQNDNNNNFVLNIVHINDHHSSLDEQSFVIPKSQLPAIERDVHRRVSYGGYPRLITMFRTTKQSRKNVLKLHAGDALTGSGFYRFFGNQPDVDMMHQVCFDAFNLGNHEFDDGDTQLADFLQKLTNHEYVTYIICSCSLCLG